MSLYNLMNGMNAELAILMSPFLPRPADQFPRFRNCFIQADDYHGEAKGDIFVYTRMGGGNRECWINEPPHEAKDCNACDANELEALAVARYDDEFDSTYSTFVFKVSDEDRADYDALVTGNMGALSDRYMERLTQIFAERDSEKINTFIAGLREFRNKTKAEVGDSGTKK
jgi:hypothetical protein